MVGRRHFALNAAGLAGALALTGLPGRARAQGTTPVEGSDFKRLSMPVAIAADGKIQVIEFFWYGCPHCFIFEPILESWVGRQRADVGFSRMPVAFDALKQTHQRIYYTWEALGVVDTMHMRTFARFHIQRKPIDSLDDMLAFAQESGLDAAKVRAAWNGFAVQTRCSKAKALAEAFDIDQTPEMAIQGRFTASGAPKNLLATTDWLVERIRHGG